MLKCDSIKLLCNFIEIALRHGCSPANLLHIFRTPFLGTPLGGASRYNYLDQRYMNIALHFLALIVLYALRLSYTYNAIKF